MLRTYIYNNCFIYIWLIIIPTLLYADMTGEFLASDNTTIANWKMESTGTLASGTPMTPDYDDDTQWYWPRGAHLALGGVAYDSNHAPTLENTSGISPFTKGLEFDGVDDWAECDGQWNGADFDYDSFEVEFWFKPYSYPSSGYRVLVGTTKWEIWLTLGSIRFVTETGTGAMYTGDRTFCIAPNNSIKTNKWNHVIAKFQDGVQTLTVSNETYPTPVSTYNTGVSAMGAVNSSINVGGRGSGVCPFEGMIAHMRISFPGMPGVDSKWQQPRTDSIDTIALLHFDEIMDPNVSPDPNCTYTADDNSLNWKRDAFDGELLGFGENEPFENSIDANFAQCIYFADDGRRVAMTAEDTIDAIVSENFRVEVWAKLDPNVIGSPSSLEYPIVSQRWAHRLVYKYWNNQWVAQAIFGYRDANDVAYGVTTMAPVDANEWNHLALQFHRGIMSLYINGELADRTFRRGILSLRVPSVSQSVGWQNSNSDFKGLVDEVYYVTTTPDTNNFEVESLLPAYLNEDTAVLTFDVNTSYPITISFKEKDSNYVPCSPTEINIPMDSNLYDLEIDINDWPDGQYEATIKGLGVSLIRGIRKQTIEGPNEPNEPVSVDGEKMLFPDSFYFESSVNLEYSVNPPELLAVTPWEEDPNVKRYTNSLRNHWFDGNNMCIRILGFDYSGDPNMIHYIASTTDFKVWDINIIDNPTSTEPNVNPYRYYDDVNDGDVNLSEVLVAYTGCSDANWGGYIMPARSKFAVWATPTENIILQQEPITQDKLEWDDDDIGDWSNTNDNFGPARLYDNNTILRFYQARRIPRWEPCRINYDNILANRIMVTWSSNDGIEWTPTYFSVPTENDPIGYQHYDIGIFNAGMNLELGYLRMYDQELQRLNTELVYSRNGLLWNRFEDGVFLDNNDTPGAWNFGWSIITSNRTKREKDGYYYEPMQGINVPHFMFLQADNVADRNTITASDFLNCFDGRLAAGINGIETTPIWDWYSSWDNIVTHSRDMTFTPGIMKYRTDGWVSVSPMDPNQNAILTTKKLTSSSMMAINAKTETGGSITIEVLDPNGDPLSDYCNTNAALFSGDSVSTNLTWKNETITEPPTNSVYKLKITIDNGVLYALYW